MEPRLKSDPSRCHLSPCSVLCMGQPLPFLFTCMFVFLSYGPRVWIKPDNDVYRST